MPGHSTALDHPALADHQRLLVVSNREPYEHERGPDGIELSRPVGGLSTALDALLARTGGEWLAWGSGDADFEATDEDGSLGVPPEDPAYTLHRLDLRDAPVGDYYHGFSNQVLWPVAHGEPDQVAPEPDFAAAYEAVNRRFADAVLGVADRDTLVWFQDYHLALAPRMVREAVGDGRSLAQFWHVPWPAPQHFAHCPDPGALLDGLLANDVLGFHTTAYRDRFVACVRRWLGDATVEDGRHRVRYRGGTTRLLAVPAGIDPRSVAEHAPSPAAAAFESDVRARANIGDTVAVSVDRLDYTKGVRERLRAFERLWERRPDLRGELSLVQKCSRTRQGIAAYREYADGVEAEVRRINDRFGSLNWKPVVHIDRRLDRASLAGLYRAGDVCVVSSLRDGLNLVAEEYAVAADDGVLVLGDGAGVTDVVGEDALLVDPTDVEGFADAIERAVELPPAERRRRLAAIRRAVERNDVAAWTRAQFRAVETAAPPALGDAGD